MNGPTLVKTFTETAALPSKPKRKASPPFSIRFTDEERARLERDAGALSLAAEKGTQTVPPARAATGFGYVMKHPTDIRFCEVFQAGLCCQRQIVCAFYSRAPPIGQFAVFWLKLNADVVAAIQCGGNRRCA